MSADTNEPGGRLAGDADAAIRQRYRGHAVALHGYVERFCTNRATAADVVQETFIRAWRHLPQLCADDPLSPDSPLSDDMTSLNINVHRKPAGRLRRAKSA